MIRMEVLEIESVNKVKMVASFVPVKGSSLEFTLTDNRKYVLRNFLHRKGLFVCLFVCLFAIVIVVIVVVVVYKCACMYVCV